MAISTKVKTTTLVKKPITKKVTIKKPIVNKLKKETIVVTDNDIKNVLIPSYFLIFLFNFKIIVIFVNLLISELVMILILIKQSVLLKMKF